MQQATLLREGDHALFATIRWPIDAIMLCLDLRDHAMTADEMFEMQLKGGFIAKQKARTARGTLNDLLNYHAGTKSKQPPKARLRRIGDKYGKAEWPDSKFC